MAENPDGLKDTHQIKGLSGEVLLKIILPAVLVISIANIAFHSSDEGTPKEVIKKAKASGNYRTAREQYEKLIKEDFFNLEYHRGYLDSCRKLSRRDDHNDENAIKEEYVYYSLDEDVNVSNVGYYGLGYFYAIRNDYGNALENYNNVKDSNLPFLNNSIGHVYLELDDTKKAKDYFYKEIEVGGNTDGAYYNLAKALYEERDFDKLKELVSDEKIKKHISEQIIRIVNLKNGRILSYIADFFNYEYVTSYGFLAAVLILITWFRYLRGIDVFEPEKLHWLLITLAGGMVFACLCTALYDFWDYGFRFDLNGHIVNDLFYCIFGIGLIEESVKIIPFLLVLRFSRLINESIDYVIYVSVSALGFAFMENLIYFQEPGIRAITGRAMISVLFHISLSTLAVYGLIYSKYRKNNQHGLLYLAGGFAAAVVLHGLFDFALMAERLPSQLKIFSIFILAVTVNKFGVITKNALNVSEFNTEQKTRVEDLTRYLVYSISAIILLQYVLMAWKFGAKNANLSMLPPVFLYYFLIMIIVSNLGKIEITQSKWTGLFEEKKRLSKIEEAARQRAAEQGADYDGLKKRYNKWEMAEGFLYIFFVCVSTTAFVFLFYWIASVIHTKKSYEYLILPSWLIFGLFSSILGFSVAVIPTNFIFESLLKGQKHKEYELYVKLKRKKTWGKKSLWGIVIWVIVVGCIVLPFLFDYYIGVRSNEIIVNEFFGFTKKIYPYDEVAEIKLIKSQKRKNGGISRKESHEIIFNDGYVLSFEGDNYNLSKDKESEIINFIAQKSGKGIQIIDPYPKRSP